MSLNKDYAPEQMVEANRLAVVIKGGLAQIKITQHFDTKKAAAEREALLTKYMPSLARVLGIPEGDQAYMFINFNPHNKHGEMAIWLFYTPYFARAPNELCGLIAFTEGGRVVRLRKPGRNKAKPLRRAS